MRVAKSLFVTFTAISCVRAAPIFYGGASHGLASAGVSTGKNAQQKKVLIRLSKRGNFSSFPAAAQISGVPYQALEPTSDDDESAPLLLASSLASTAPQLEAADVTINKENWYQELQKYVSQLFKAASEGIGKGVIDKVKSIWNWFVEKIFKGGSDDSITLAGQAKLEKGAEELKNILRGKEAARTSASPVNLLKPPTENIGSFLKEEATHQPDAHIHFITPLGEGPGESNYVSRLDHTLGGSTPPHPYNNFAHGSGSGHSGVHTPHPKVLADSVSGLSTYAGGQSGGVESSDSSSSSTANQVSLSGHSLSYDSDNSAKDDNGFTTLPQITASTSKSSPLPAGKHTQISTLRELAESGGGTAVTNVLQQIENTRPNSPNKAQAIHSIGNNELRKENEIISQAVDAPETSRNGKFQSTVSMLPGEQASPSSRGIKDDAKDKSSTAVKKQTGGSGVLRDGPIDPLWSYKLLEREGGTWGNLDFRQGLPIEPQEFNKLSHPTERYWNKIPNSLAGTAIAAEVAVPKVDLQQEDFAPGYSLDPLERTQGNIARPHSPVKWDTNGMQYPSMRTRPETLMRPERAPEDDPKNMGYLDRTIYSWFGRTHDKHLPMPRDWDELTLLQKLGRRLWANGAHADLRYLWCSPKYLTRHPKDAIQDLPPCDTLLYDNYDPKGITYEQANFDWNENGRYGRYFASMNDRRLLEMISKNNGIEYERVQDDPPSPPRAGTNTPTQEEDGTLFNNIGSRREVTTDYYPWRLPEYEMEELQERYEEWKAKKEREED